ncbi:hypothetical protein H8E77_01415 [bacterium]|nr:hypothetical protein [bacterium]
MPKIAEQMDANILYYTDRKNVWGLGLDSESQNICLKNNLLPYIKQVHDTIYETYGGVSFVEPKLIEDSEIPNYQKICFEIHLTGEPVQILKDEEKFYVLFLEKVPEEKQHFFTFTYRVL